MNSAHETAGARDRFRGDPHPSLRPFVVEYWAIARDLAAMGGFSITPDYFGELICFADDLYAVGGGRKEKLPTCFFVGLLREPLRIEAAGVVRCMAARLRPWTVGRFAAPRPGLPSRGWKDAAGVFGPRLAVVTEMVRRRDWHHLTALFDQVLIEEVARWEPGETGADLVGLFIGDGRRPTAAVAGERDISSRQVERRVRRLTRTSPKQLACLSRFQKARDAIWADPSADMARLALEAGYSDQPHLTREFRRYSGLTPTRFARESAARKQWLATHCAFRNFQSLPLLAG